MDPLDAILDALRLESVVSGVRSFGAPFGVRVDPGPVAALHIVITGTCTVRLPGQAVRRLGPGDAMLMPHGSRHDVCDRPGRALVSAVSVTASCPVVDGRLEYGGPGPRTDFLCGGFRYARGAAHRLLDDLPELVVTTPADGSASPAMVAIQQAMAHEQGLSGAGQVAAVKALSSAWFVAFLRARVGRAGIQDAGWIAGLRDARTARVMAAMHHRCAEAWSIEGLAEVAGMSRSQFAARFTATVGETPLAYLNRWRVQRAGEALRSGSTVDEAAKAVGFASAPVLIRVFKRYHGATPGAWLRTAV